ncbi:hypothetical protein EVA_06745 [gut metagenome]|uniref:Uncharacterized protein n=1 Tax=gut metagenome TaxID=749906 RepID=J9GRI1_9ZZZZ
MQNPSDRVERLLPGRTCSCGASEKRAFSRGKCPWGEDDRRSF